ncbi:hypothetical protein HIM_01160 [Hirsutella minnesotensis 3608]|nr:hypothetical protein HIM_01160 [Hirsutella minnesotensis 3608]
MAFFNVFRALVTTTVASWQSSANGRRTKVVVAGAGPRSAGLAASLTSHLVWQPFKGLSGLHPGVFKVPAPEPAAGNKNVGVFKVPDPEPTADDDNIQDWEMVFDPELGLIDDLTAEFLPTVASMPGGGDSKTPSSRS